MDTRHGWFAEDKPLPPKNNKPEKYRVSEMRLWVYISAFGLLFWTWLVDAASFPFFSVVAFFASVSAVIDLKRGGFDHLRTKEEDWWTQWTEDDEL